MPQATFFLTSVTTTISRHTRSMAAVYEARPDAGSTAHTHTAAAMAYSALPDRMLPISPKGIRFAEALASHSFEGIFDNPEERARLMSDMGDLDAALLENHGYLVCGPTVSGVGRFLRLGRSDKGASRRCRPAPR